MGKPSKKEIQTFYQNHRTPNRITSFDFIMAQNNKKVPSSYLILTGKDKQLCNMQAMFKEYVEKLGHTTMVMNDSEFKEHKRKNAELSNQAIQWIEEGK